MILAGCLAFCDFVTNWPILALPAALLLYLCMIRAGFSGSQRMAMICLALPGILLTAVWLTASDGDFFSFLLISLFFIPTNLLAPLIVCFWIAQAFIRSYSKRDLAAKVNFFASILILVLYFYDQMIVFAKPGDS